MNLSKHRPIFFQLSAVSVCLAFLSGCGEDLRLRISDLEVQLAKEKAALASASAEVARQKIALVELDAQLVKEKAATASVEAELAKERASLATANADLVKERAALASLSAELARERSAKAEAAAKTEAERIDAANRNAVLTAQLGLTMKSGDTKPVANAKVYLTQKSSAEILAGIQVVSELGTKIDLPPIYVWGKAMGEWSLAFSDHAAKVSRTLASEAIAVADTDFSGVAVFEDLPKGDYYVICATALGKGAVLEKRVSINSAKAKTALSNSDVIAP
jgi:hypothetical protein